MSEIYSKYLSLNESKNVSKSPSKKSVRKPLKEDANYGEGEKAIKKVVRVLERNGFYVDDYKVEYENFPDMNDGLKDGEYLEEEWAFIRFEEPIKTQEDFDKIGNIVSEELAKQGYDYIDSESVMLNSEVGKNVLYFRINDAIMYESRKKSILKNKKKLSEKSKNKAIKEWRRNISGYSEISDEEVKKYQSELDEIGDKIEKEGISVKKIGQVNVEEFEGSDDYFTEEAWGYIELSKPIKDEDEFEKICDIVEPYIDNRLSDVKDIGGVGSIQLYITFKVVDRFWDDEELEESSSKKSRFYKKRLSEKNINFDKKVKELESYLKNISKDFGTEFKSIVSIDDNTGLISIRFDRKGDIVSLKKQMLKDGKMQKQLLKTNTKQGIISGYLNLEEGLKEKSKLVSFINKKRLGEKDSKTFNKAFKDFENLVREVAKSIGLDMYIDDISVFSEYDGKILVDFEDKAPSQKVEALRKSLEDDIRVEKITKKGNGFVVVFKEKYRNLEESIKNRKISMFKNISFKESKMKRKALKESDKYWEAYEQAKKIIQDANVPEVYVDDVKEEPNCFVFVMESNDGDKKETIMKSFKKIRSTFSENNQKYPLIYDVTLRHGKDYLAFIFYIDDEDEYEWEGIGENKKLAKKVKNVVENKKRKSFKEFKKLKESRKKLSKRKLNESDSVSIDITFDNYRECLRAVFKEMGENLSRDQLDWYVELGMEMAIDPNSMYEWIRNETELLSVEEIKEYKDLGDVSDEEAIDFARERGYYEGEVNGDTYFLVPLGE